MIDNVESRSGPGRLTGTTGYGMKEGIMGIRGELYSTKVILKNRTYFFNVKENRMGDLYLNIVESKNKDTGGFERQSVVLFADDLQDFLKGFDESLRVLEKEEREKRKTGEPKRKEERSAERNEPRDYKKHNERPEKSVFIKKRSPEEKTEKPFHRENKRKVRSVKRREDNPRD